MPPKFGLFLPAALRSGIDVDPLPVEAPDFGPNVLYPRARF